MNLGFPRSAQRADAPATLRTGHGDASARWASRGTSAYRRISIALFLAGFSTFSLLYCVQPLLPVFAQDFGVSPATSSLSLSLSTGFLALAILCAAALSEGLGRRGLMFGSMAAAALLNVAAALAPAWHALLVLRALEGFVLGGVPAVAMAYLAEEIDPDGLGFSMGLYVAGTAFGGMIGRVGTGILAEFFSWRLALAAIGVAGLAAAAGFILLLPASRNFVRRPGFDAQYHVRAWSGHLRQTALPLLFAIGFLAMGAFVAVYNYAGFRLMAPPYDLNQTELGLIFTVYLFGIGASSVAGALADRIGRGRVLPAGIVITALGIGLTCLQSLSALILGIVVLTIGFFITHSVASGWVGRLAAGAKGHASSLYLLAYYLGSSVAGSAGGWFWAEGGWSAIALFTLALLAIGLAAAMRLNQVTRDRSRIGG
ncbi:MAG: MFS transporter [Acetobacteraceae bacterium]